MAKKPILLDYDPGVFHDNYFDAAREWEQRLDCVSLPVKREDYRHPVGEIDGKPLVCQTVWLGNGDASQVMVLIAGTHGVEGYAGSGVQCDLLSSLAVGHVELPQNTAILLIHALNPWGYAYSRRCDEKGIDVNRNFVDFSRPLPENPGFHRVREVFRLTDRTEIFAALQKLAQVMGQWDYEIALSGGQYEEPHLPFYGGAGASFSRSVIENLIARYHLDKRRLAVVDVHTGLGPYGYGEVICDHPSGSGSAITARKWYGQACAMADTGASFSVPKLGLLDYAWHAVMDDHSAFITLEFGTLGMESLFGVLLDESLAWMPGKADDKTRNSMAQAMKMHFFPADASWREGVIFRSRQVIQQALHGVSAQ